MNTLIVEVLEEERSGLGLFRVHQEFVWEDEVRGTITIPVGFETDFASIPRIARWLMGSAGKCAIPAMLHDYVLTANPPIEQKWATGVFNRALKKAGCWTPRRWLMVAFVAIYTAPFLLI